MMNNDILELDTPCLILDKQKLENNIDRMTTHLSNLGVQLRPHVKTTKCLEAARLIFNGGVGPITVSTIREAEYFLEGGFSDIIYAVSIVPTKLARVKKLMKAGADIKLVLDNVEVANALSNFANSNNITFDVFIEIDSDNHRAGLKPDDPKVMQLTKALHEFSNIHFLGFLTHAGESYNCHTTAEIKQHAEIERDAVLKCAEDAHNIGISSQVISLGSTPTATFSTDLTGVDEVRAGIFVFQDLVQAGLGCCEVNDIALSVLTTVISHKPEHNRIIIDAGGVALSKDRGTQTQTQDYGYGLVCDVDGVPLSDTLVVESANQEHGIITSNVGEINFDDFPIGSLLRILPNHSCMTAAAHTGYNVVDKDGKNTEFWQRCQGW
jgi:D-serine deaminase-like pyridoxal phosphate-dependent protein